MIYKYIKINTTLNMILIILYIMHLNKNLRKKN
jgi:hypothetical protein